MAAATFAWTQRVYAAVPLAPGWVGVGLAGALFGLFLLVELALGRRPFVFRGDILSHSGEALITLLLCVLLAYLCTASVSAAREAPRAVRRVRHLLRGSGAELDALEAEAGRRPRRMLLVAGLVGALVSLGVPFLEAETGPWRVYDWHQWTPESAWHRVLSPALGWWMGRLLGLMLFDSRRFSRLATRIGEVDLLDLRPLEPFVGFGLANALRVTGFVALFAFLLIDLGRYGLVVLFIAGLTIASATAALLLPVRGVRRRIRDAKRAELDAVHAAIRGDPGALAGSALSGRAGTPSLADLVAYRELVAGVREWPFDASTFYRFALYLMIPLGSWLGGAFVERLVDAALG